VSEGGFRCKHCGGPMRELAPYVWLHLTGDPWYAGKDLTHDAEPEHLRDEHCVAYLDDGTCDVCGAYHGEPCRFCGGRGHHAADDCPGIFDPSTKEHEVVLRKWNEDSTRRRS